MLAGDSLRANSFRIRWQFRGLAALVGFGCLVVAGYVAFALFRAAVPEDSSNLEHALIAVAMLLASYVFCRLAWTGSGRFLARFFDVEMLRREAEREQQERARLWERAAMDLPAAEELHKRLRLDLAADAEIERKETRSQQLHLLGLREQDTRKQMRELETIIRRLRGI